MQLSDTATDAEVWGLISRLQGIDGSRLSSRSVAAIHRIIDQAQPSDFPDLDSQTKQAAWTRDVCGIEKPTEQERERIKQRIKEGLPISKWFEDDGTLWPLGRSKAKR